MGVRRRAREIALQVLYQRELSCVEVEEALHLFWNNFEVLKGAMDFSERLIKGVEQHREDLDRIIEQYSSNWKVDRMTHVDRTILRIAVYELLYCDDIPPRVAINEAIDIGKKYGSEDSGAFINGILDKVKSEERRQAE
ncbi:MAG: transcription antitermination factor NusB [Syntrophobacterales bacterium]|nr:MAG: transcription antitermination factor NusB [Syntrophobacterales bacterium]